jgi:hypothetical protein
MRSIFVLLILVMIGLNGKGQSVTALPDSVLSQCCLEVTLLNGNVTTVDWVFIQYITRDGSGTKLFVEYAPNFGGIQWETQIRIQDDFDDVLERSKFIVIPFTVGSTDYGINRNWIANIEENTTTGGTWIYGRFGTPTKRKFSAVEDYETMKNLLLACHPRAIVVAENGLYTEGDTVRMGGFLIEPTTITTEGYNWMMKDTLSKTEFGIDYLTAETGDTTVYWGRRSGSVRQMIQMGNRYWYNTMKDTVGGLFSDLTHSWNSGNPFLKYLIFNSLDPNSGTAWFQVQKDNSFLIMSNETTNPYYTPGWAVTNNTVQIGVNENGSGDPGNGVVMGAYGFGTTEYLYMITKGVDDNTATNGQYLQLKDVLTGEVDFATIDLSGYLPIADTAAMLDPYIQGAGTINNLAKFTAGRVVGDAAITENGSRVVMGLPMQLKEYSLVGLPTGVTKDMYWVTGAGPAWYQGARLAYGLESTASVFTSGSLIFANTNGQAAQDNANLFWNNTSKRLGIGTTSPSQAFEIYTTTTTLIDLLKVQTANCANCNIKLSMNGFEGIISSALLRIKSIGTNTPFIYFGNGGVIDMGFETISSTNKVNINSALNLSGKFGFAWTAGTARVQEAIKQETTYNTNEAGISFATYGVVNNIAQLNKGQVQFKMSPSKENWVGDGTVNTDYNFYVTQPGSGYGSISTTSGSSTIVCPYPGYSLFTKDFNVGTSITLNSTTFTITGITNNYTATVSPTPGFTGTYDYTINNASPIRFGVYKNGGVEINQAIGQTRDLLRLKNSSGDALVQINKDGDFTVKKPSSPDSVTINKSGVLIKANGTNGSFNSKFEVFDYGYLNNTLAIATADDARYNFDRSRGTIAAPTALLKNDRVGGVYFRAHNGSSYQKVGYMGAVIDSIFSGANPNAKLIFGVSEVNSPETSSYWRFLVEATRNISTRDHVSGANMGVGFGSNISIVETATIDARFHIKGGGTTTGKTMLLEDSGGADILTVTDNKLIQMHGYGAGTKEAAGLSKTQSAYIAGFATDGTLLDYPLSGLGTGSVTSVGLSLPSIFSVSGSPVTTSGTLSATFTGGDTRQVLRGDGIWANTLDSFRINQSLASVERFEVNGNILLNRGSGSNKLILTRNWNQEISAGGSNGNMNFVNGSGSGFQNYFILGTVAGIDTMVTMHYNGLGVAVGKSNKIQARLHVKGAGTTTGKTMLLEDSGGADILTVTDDKTIQAHGYGTGTKEAADLSKTQSNYIAGFATDGTVLDLNIGTGLAISGGSLTATASAPTQILAESYNRITSTSSPQTFSSTISDNIVDQGSTQASFTFDFPASPADGQILTMTWNNAISVLTLNGNGNTIVGTAVTTAVAGTQRKFKYCGTCTTPAWIKIY